MIDNTELIEAMKKFKNTTAFTIDSVLCDRCSREVQIDDIEFQEFTSIQYRGAYNSIFGDGMNISIDVCQHCLKETLGPWLKIENPFNVTYE